jgi:hypothetical protein
MIPLTTREEASLQDVHPASPVYQAIRFVLHLAAVYLIVWFMTPWLAGRWHDWVLPLMSSSFDESRLQVLFSHVLALTFIPGFIVGCINAKYQHKVALFVWIVPTAILIYFLVTFPTSIFQDHWMRAFHYYFAGGLLLPEFYSYRDLFTRIMQNGDAVRGLAQLRVTGPVYAGVGYSLGALLSVYLKRRVESDDSLATDLD